MLHKGYELSLKSGISINLMTTKSWGKFWMRNWKDYNRKEIMSFYERIPPVYDMAMFSCTLTRRDYQISKEQGSGAF